MSATEITYRIEAEIFAMFPGYVRGVVVACGVENGPSPEDLVAMLREAEASARASLDLDTLAEHPRMAAWREAYRRFGAKPAKFRPSMEAMARRVLREQELPSISRLVDIGNIVSLRHLMPVGGHAIDVVTSDISLRTASGTETFVPFGSDQAEQPLEGEVIFTEGDTVLTRRWTWRQANHTLVAAETTALEFNIDGLPPAAPTEVDAACREVTALVERFCGGHLRHDILSVENDRIALAAIGSHFTRHCPDTP